MASPRASREALPMHQSPTERQVAFDLPERLQRVANDRAQEQDAARPSTQSSNVYGLESVDEKDHDYKEVRKSWMPARQAWRTFFSQEVAKDHILELQLMLITISTGIQDATTFATYQVFTTKQTGNTLFLALYALRHQALGEAVEQNVGVSLGCFILGAAFFGHIGRHLKQRRRAWLIAMNFFQVLLVLGAAAIRWWAPHVRAGGSALGVVALLSFASSGQIAMAVGVGLAELNTTMITGTLVQLSNDPNILKANNPARNRRIMFYTSLLAGCFIGAAACKLDAALGLLLTAAVKLLATVSFLLNPGVVEVNDLDREKANDRPRTGTITPVSKILWGD